MSAIDELRRLLDERGVAHSDHYFSTTWRDGHGILHLAGEPMADGSLVVDMLTPEQAIAATLGNSRAERITDDEWEIYQHSIPATDENMAKFGWVRERTCRIVKNSRKYVLSDGRELFEDGCSICNGYVGDGDNYCSNCGARVVE